MADTIRLADTLTRDCGVPFRVAHAICAHVVAARAHLRMDLKQYAEAAADYAESPVHEAWSKTWQEQRENSLSFQVSNP